MTFSTRMLACAAVAAGTIVAADRPAAQPSPARPAFADGQAQIVPAFQDPSEWIRETLWVETEFDSDKDGRKDRVFTGVTRPEASPSPAACRKT